MAEDKLTSHSSIIEKIREKQVKQDISVVDGFPLLVNVSENVIMGSFSWYWMSSKHKDIARKFALNFGGTITTPAEVARTYLELKYPRQRATGEQAREFKRARSAPLYAQPHSFEDAVYIDIKAAYWQILQIVGWDVDYNPNKWLGKNGSMDDYPYADIKLSRNCMVTAGLPSETAFWKGSKQSFETMRTGNRLQNMGIWAATMDILHGVAWDAIKAGAVYAHTDGYICATERMGSVLGAISEWGLQASVKRAGKAEVYGVGSYSFGDQSTRTPKQKHAYDGLLLNPYNEWLKRKVRFFSERTNFVWRSTFEPTAAKS